jgi:hypothetical protein
MANSRHWASELQWHMNCAVQLEHVDGTVANEVLARGAVVADFAWRDPSVS